MGPRDEVDDLQDQLDEALQNEDMESFQDLLGDEEQDDDD